MSRKKRFEEKHVRIQKNQVSGEMEYTVLDAVQKAFERSLGVAETFMLDMAPPERDRLIQKLVPALIRKLSCGYTDSENNEVGLLHNLIYSLADRTEIQSRLLGRKAEKGSPALVLVEALAS